MKICISDNENFLKPTLFSPLFILQLGISLGKKIEDSSLEKLTSIRDKVRDTGKMVESGRCLFQPPTAANQPMSFHT